MTSHKDTFNKNSHEKNILLSSGLGVVEQIVNYVLAFVFRTVFLYVLSANYLGIEGLFTNILQLFSMAELGIGLVIAFKMYKPISCEDLDKCAALLKFYKHFYWCLAGVILLMGAALYPFLGYLIADTSTLPSDVNLSLIYWLYVLQSSTSYLFVYMQTLLTADQKGYIISLANSLCGALVNAIKIVVLLVTRDFTITLIVGIVIGLLYQLIFSFYIRHKYIEIVRRQKASLKRSEKIQIFKDTGALLCHRVGYMVLKSTDSIIVSSFLGLATLGIYTNYAMISEAIEQLYNKLFGSFVSSIGDMALTSSSDEKYNHYKRLRFLNIWAGSFAAVCFFVLVNPFIQVWLGENFLLDMLTVTVLSLNMFFNFSRVIDNAFINATGLFVKDKVRPLIEATLNLVISIVLVNYLGIAGVFIGTVVSTLLTVFWRMGVILYRDVFERSVKDYFLTYGFWLVLTTALGLGLFYICSFFGSDIWGFVLKVVICVVGTNLVFAAVFHRNESFKFFLNKGLNYVKKFLRKS